MLDHNLHQVLEGCLLRIPSQLGLRLCRITKQLVYLCRTEILRIDLNEGLACFLVVTFLVDTVTSPFLLDAHFFEGQCGKLADGMIFTCGNHEVIWFRLLQDKPHAFDVVFGISPVA